MKSSQFIFEVCPCDLECPAGCEGCSNSICEDPNSSTTVSTITTGVSSEKAALMLNTARSENVPMVITFNGDVDDKINFIYDERTEVYISCGVTLNEEFWIFGGAQHRQQVGKF